MSSAKWRPFCLGLNVLNVCDIDMFVMIITLIYSPLVQMTYRHSDYPTLAREFQGFGGMRKICISNAGTHGHIHQLRQSGQSRSRSWPITQCHIARAWESAPKHCAVMAIVEDGSPTFETVLRELSGSICILSVGQKQKPILNGFFDTDLHSVSWI